jgi:hypothetical protein
VDVQVDEAGGDDEAAGIEFFVGAGADFAGQRDFFNAAVAEQDVHGGVELLSWIDDVPAFDEK